MIASTEGLRAAILNARAAALNAEISGMVADNQHRMNCGMSVAHCENDFPRAIERHRLGENNVILVAAHGEL